MTKQVFGSIFLVRFESLKLHNKVFFHKIQPRMITNNINITCRLMSSYVAHLTYDSSRKIMVILWKNEVKLWNNQLANF